MITKKQIEIFKYFQGDIDMWARIGTKEEKEIMSDDNWYSIYELLQDIANSKEKEEDIRKSLEKEIEDKEVIDELIKIAIDKKDLFMVIPDPTNLKEMSAVELIRITTSDKKYHKPETIAAAEKEIKKREKKGTIIWERYNKK